MYNIREYWGDLLDDIWEVLLVDTLRGSGWRGLSSCRLTLSTDGH